MKFVKKVQKIQTNKTTTKYYFLGLRLLKKTWSPDRRETYLFNFKISKHKFQTNVSGLKIIDNDINIKKLFDKKTKVKKRPIDIIIPVYNGFEHLDPLFESVMKNTDLDYKLFIINDKSTDKKVLPLLKKWAKKFGKKAVLLQNKENLGFVQTVNRGLAETTRDVVLLNTDVRLPKNWASRLMQPIFESDDIASVTPFSNSATIFSFPRQWGHQDLEMPLQDIDNIFSKLSFDKNLIQKLNFPTGVGFCMAMSRVAIDKVGVLDTIFGRGYGEENDWCMRALNAGLKNTLAYNLFAFHKHGSSFGEEKQRLILEHSVILKERYPDYSDLVQLSGNSGLYQTLRFIINLLYTNKLVNKTYVVFDHSLGGGTETYFYNKVKEAKDENLVVRIQYYAYTHMYLMTVFYKDTCIAIQDLNLDNFVELLNKINIDEIVVNNLVGYTNIAEILSIIKTLKGKKTHVSMRGHDYQSICPFFTLMDNNKYCGLSGIEQCKKCFINNNFVGMNTDENVILKSGATDIVSWRKAWNNFFKNTLDEMVVFSENGRDLFTRVYPVLKDKMKIIPHETYKLRPVVIKKHKNLIIGILGNISSVAKGQDILSDMQPLCKKYKVKLVVIGTCNIKNIKQTGQYNVNDLPHLIEKNNIGVIFIPSVWPETFSYTTSEAISMEIPVACFNMGAPAERVKKYEKGIIIDKIDAESVLNKITNSKIIKRYDLIRNSGLFDKKYYYKNNQDVKKAKIDPIHHYMQYGWYEGREPSNKFSGVSYCNRYPDVKRAQINPLLHYLEHGKKENRINPKEYTLTKKLKLLAKIKQKLAFNKSKKILLLSHEFSYTGAPLSLLKAAECLKEMGYNVITISQVDGPLKHEFEKIGKVVVTQNIRDICMIASECGFAIVNTLVLYLIHDALKQIVPTVWWIREPASYINTYPDMLKSVHKAKNIYTMSEYSRCEFLKYNDNIKVIKHGIDDFYNNKHIDTKNIVFAVIGSVCSRKGQDVFINAIKLLPKNLRKKAKFVVVGKQRGSKDFIQFIDDNAKYIELRDEIKDIKELLKSYESISCVVVPSRNEPTSRVAIESMMMGRPVILSDHVGAKYLVEPEKNGFIFENENAEQLAKYMGALIKNPEKLSGMEDLCRKTYESNNSIPVYKENLAKMLQGEYQTIDYKSLLTDWFFMKTKQHLDLDNPQTFNEKIQYLKLFDSTPEKTRLTDKYLVRDWVESKIGKQYLIHLLGVYNKVEDIDFDKLPKRFVIKCNHGSGWNIIVKDKSELDLQEVKEKLNLWMSTNFAYNFGFELQYKDIKPKIIIEKYVTNDDKALYDYKFWCFNGEVKYMQFRDDFSKDLKMAFYDLQWKKQHFYYDHPLLEGELEKPDNFDEMVDIAKKLCKGFCFVCVNLYRLNNGNIKFGEMTFTRSSGTGKWNDDKYNKMLGDMIRLPKKPKNKH